MCDLKFDFEALEITNCDLKTSASFCVNLNMKSLGKRFLFRDTRSFERFVGMSYNSAKSKSSIIF